MNIKVVKKINKEIKWLDQQIIVQMLKLMKNRKNESEPKYINKNEVRSNKQVKVAMRKVDK